MNCDLKLCDKKCLRWMTVMVFCEIPPHEQTNKAWFLLLQASTCTVLDFSLAAAVWFSIEQLPSVAMCNDSDCLWHFNWEWFSQWMVFRVIIVTPIIRQNEPNMDQHQVLPGWALLLIDLDWYHDTTVPCSHRNIQNVGCIKSVKYGTKHGGWPVFLCKIQV